MGNCIDVFEYECGFHITCDNSDMYIPDEDLLIEAWQALPEQIKDVESADFFPEKRYL